MATFDGHVPGIALDDARRPLLVHALAAQDGGTAIMARSASRDGAAWDAPIEILAPRNDLVLGSNRLVRTRRGRWLLPVVAAGAPQCLTSDDGRTWSLSALPGWPQEGRWPAIVESADGNWFGFVALGTSLARARSTDAGATWSAFEALIANPRIDTESAFAAGAAADGCLLAWVETPPDTGVALPGVWTLRLASTSAARTGLEWLAPVTRRAGDAIATPALCDAGKGAALAWFTARRGATATAACVRIVPEARRAGVATADDAATKMAHDASAALDLWTAHVLARPAPSQRLFIEGYCMRGLVAAQAVLGGHAGVAAPSTRALVLPGSDIDGGVLRARSFADWLLAGQDANGYWPLGYKALYVADMAAVVGLYAALAPHVDAETQARWTDSARRFAAALERDGLVLANGACGVGWVETRERDDTRIVREPYLVSTALAGIETHAWLYARTRDPAFARRGRAALEYTLAALQPDGSLPAFAAGELREGAYLAAAYVQEGWMAADRLLDDPEVTALLRRRLAPHVDWLVRTQRPGGIWGEAGDGESARTVAIPNFLIWYDRRCESRADVREAIRRAGIALVNPDRWLESGLLRPGKHEDVQRALAGRTLAALASGEPVF
jgi:hypothetical protein